MTLRELIEEVAKRNPTNLLDTEILFHFWNGEESRTEFFEISITNHALEIDNPDDAAPKPRVVGIDGRFDLHVPYVKRIEDSPTTPQNVVRLELFDENGNSEFILDRTGETFEETKEIMGKAIEAVEERSNESA